MKKIINEILIYIFVIMPLFVSAQNLNNLQQDSLFEKISIEDLEKIKEFYKNKAEKLRKDEQASLVEGKELGESFLSDQAFRIEDRDKIYIRIAEYYIEQAERDFDDLFDVYEEKLEQFQQGQITEEPEPPESPSYDYSKAISIYDKLLEEYPSSEYADDALYTKAWLKEQMGEGSESRRLFQEVIDKYPDSHYAAESYMQLAEYFFNPREDKTDD